MGKEMNSAMDCRRPRGTCVRVSFAGARNGGGNGVEAVVVEEAAEAPDTVVWAATRAACPAGHIAARPEQHERLQFSRPDAGACPCGGSIAHTGRSR